MTATLIQSPDRVIFSIYADLRIPEFWQYDGKLLTIHILQGNQYDLSDRSIALPLLQAETVMKILELHSTIGENGLVKQLR